MTPAEILKRETARAARQKLELAMAFDLRVRGLAVGLVREHEFHPTRKWRFDFAYPAHQLAVEVDGGAHSEGRHTRGAGFEADAEKLNEAVCAGWRVLRVTGKHIKSGAAAAWIERALQ